jgi:hypothetical protein
MAGLQKIMVEQLPGIPLTNEPYWYEYSTVQFVGWPDANHQYAVPYTSIACSDVYALMPEQSGEAVFRPVVMRLGNYGDDVLDLFFQLEVWACGQV